jgi:hypothetical protein
MRSRLTAFVLLVVPPLLWVPVHAWATSKAAGWPHFLPDLSSFELMVLAVDNWISRWGLWFVLAGTVAMPLLGFLASFVAPRDLREVRRALVAWCILSAALAAIPTLAGGAAYEYKVWSDTLLEWASLVTYALSVGCAVVLLRARGPSQKVPGSASLWWSMAALTLMGLFSFLLPVAMWAYESHADQSRSSVPHNNEMKLTRSDG